MTQARPSALLRLLSPGSVAVVGGEAAAIVARQCQRIGFAGSLAAVHPTRATLADIACVKSVGELAQVPDAVFLGVSPELTVATVKQLSEQGAGGAVCYASGFAESGGDGERLQQELVQGAGPMPLMGPNCHGFINYLDGVALWPDHFGGERTLKGPALLMQSGNIGINVTFEQRQLEPSYVIAMGNNAKLGVHDYIHAMLDDSRVTAIGLHLEGIGDVAKFTQAAIRALELGVPLVALKSGSSQLGAQLALSHTRSLSNPDDLVTLMFERYGVARCHSLPEFLETLKFVSVGGAILRDTGGEQETLNANTPNHGAYIASMSCSGGEASHLADLAGRFNVGFTPLSASTCEALGEVLGDRVHVSNPLDYHTYAWGDLDTLTRAFTLMLNEDVDCALLILDYPPPEKYDVSLWQVAEQALCAASAASGTRIVVVSSLAENFPESARARLSGQGVAPMQGLQECLQAVVHARNIGRAQQHASDLKPITTLPLGLNDSASRRQVLDELASKRELAGFGLTVPKSRLCTPQDAVAAAQSLGYPVAIKALGEEFAHKTELNAVRLNVSSATEAALHAEELGQLTHALLVETMVEEVALELLVGVVCDEHLGQVIVLGAGGTEVELHRDSVQLLLPVSREAIKKALLSLRIAPVFTGFRGRGKADLSAALDAIEAIASYAQANRHRLAELDVNPLVIREVPATSDQKDTLAKRPRAVVVDALIQVVSP